MLQTIADSIQSFLPDVDGAVAAGLQAFGAIVALVITWRLFVVAQSQTQATQLMAELQQADAEERQRPAVVLDLVLKSPYGKRHYVARNVGRGPALNSFLVDDLEADKPELLVLGSLLPGEHVVVPDEAQRKLDGQQQAFDRAVFTVAAQPSKQGSPWQVSVNRVDRNGRVSHEVRDWTPSGEFEKRSRMLTLDEQLRAYIAKKPAGSSEASTTDKNSG